MGRGATGRPRPQENPPGRAQAAPRRLLPRRPRPPPGRRQRPAGCPRPLPGSRRQPSGGETLTPAAQGATVVDTLEALEADRGYDAYARNTVRAHYDDGWEPTGIREARELLEGTLDLRTIALEGKQPPAGATRWNREPSRTWKALPNPTNVGILGGDGVGVVDIDRRGAWADLFNRNLAQLADLTPVVVTGSGGIHVYFRTPRARVPCGSLPGGAGELIGDGWLAVTPPSRHPSTGLAYRFSQRPVEIAPLEDLRPTWSLDDIGDDQEETPDPPSVEAREGLEDLETRVEKYLTTNPVLRDKYDDLQAGRSPDRSRDEYAICVGLLEAGFDTDDVYTWLLRNGPKARERGKGYARRTVDRAAQEA